MSDVHIPEIGSTESLGEGSDHSQAMDISTTELFRHNSVTLGGYPWGSGVVMQPDFSKLFDKSHYAYRFCVALQDFDIKVSRTSATQAYIRAALRDVACDRYSQNTSAEIVSSEMRDLMRSVGHASEVCSAVTAYRVLDILYALEKPDTGLRAPIHRRLHMNFSAFPVTKLVADWTAIAQRFQKSFNTRRLMGSSSPTFNTFSSRQVDALYHLHNNMQTNKSLFNLQLAATHLAFMLDQASGDKVPDLPTALDSLDTSNIRSPTESATLKSQFQTLLTSLEVELRFDYLRLPLQVAAILTPIVLLQDTIIHESKSYCQRYKLMLYAKCLGNVRPKSVVCLETVIWKALFNMACGEIDVYAAAQSIATAIPTIMENLEDGDNSWFHLGNASHKDKFHLSSAALVQSSVPKDWPMSSTLSPAMPTPPSCPSPSFPFAPLPEASNTASPGDQHMDIDDQDGLPLPVNANMVILGDIHNDDPDCSTIDNTKGLNNSGDRMQVDDQHSPSLPSRPLRHTSKRKYTQRDTDESSGEAQSSDKESPSENTIRRSARNVKPSKHAAYMGSQFMEANPGSSKHKRKRRATAFTPIKSEEPTQRPVLMGSKYMHLTVIDLTKVERASHTLDLSSVPFRGTHPDVHHHFTAYNPYGEESQHSIRFYRKAECVSFKKMMTRVSAWYHAGQPKHISASKLSIFRIIQRSQFDAMSASQVQILLRKGVIVLPDIHIKTHSFSRHAIRELNSLNIDVKIEDQSLLPLDSRNIKIGTLHQFVDNAESQYERKVLRVIHAPSDFVQQLPFTTEHLAWRETRTLAYCKEEDNSVISLLRWNDFSNADDIQWWRLVPHGFGLFLDVRAGSQLIVIAAPSTSPFDSDELANTELFLPLVERTDAINEELTHPEAILLTAGMRIILPPNTIYATVSVEDSIITGGYYLSSHMLCSSMYGLVHAFILGDSATNANDILPGFHIRRLIHYLHTSYVVNNLIDTDDEYHHLLTFKDIIGQDGKIVKKGMDDVKALFALFAMAIFANAMDKRTYMPFTTFNTLSPEEQEEQKKADLNAIPLLERRHYCYTRGLALDLIYWFFNHFALSKPRQDDDDDAFNFILIPLLAELGQAMIAYKFEVISNTTVSGEDFQYQVERALSFGRMEEAFDEIESVNESFAFDLDDYDVTAFNEPREIHAKIVDFFLAGKNSADEIYFAALES